MKVSKEIKVDVLAVAAIAILYIGFNFLKGTDFFDPSNSYYVVYTNVDGLSVSNPVKVNGYRVGRVNSIELLQQGEDTRMLVGIEVTDDLELYQGNSIPKAAGALLLAPITGNVMPITGTSMFVTTGRI